MKNVRIFVFAILSVICDLEYIKMCSCGAEYGKNETDFCIHIHLSKYTYYDSW